MSSVCRILKPSDTFQADRTISPLSRPAATRYLQAYTVAIHSDDSNVTTKQIKPAYDMCQLRAGLGNGAKQSISIIEKRKYLAQQLHRDD